MKLSAPYVFWLPALVLRWAADVSKQAAAWEVTQTERAGADFDDIFPGNPLDSPQWWRQKPVISQPVPWGSDVEQ
jgi:hypothetical protein